MAGLFGLSVSGCAESRLFPKWLYWGTSYVRHFGEENCGLAVSDRKAIRCEVYPGLFSSNFGHRINDFKGVEGIGYCGHFPEPFFAKKSRFGPFAICFSGRISNLEILTSQLESCGHIFERGDEAEVIAKLIVQGQSVVEGIQQMDSVVEGAYVLLVLARSGLYGVRSASGQWLLTIGKHKKEDAMCISSATVGFYNLDFEIVREIVPGEIVFLDLGREPLIQQKYRVEKRAKTRQCSFWPVYTSSPADRPYGKPATLVREELGACLAKRDIVNGFVPHIVMPVPDSGRGCALGYHHEFCRQIMLGKIKTIPFYQEWLMKYGFFRSFLAPSPKEREEIAHYKIVITSERIGSFLKMLQTAGLDSIAEDITKNKRIVIAVCDDSIVRGNQAKTNLVPKIRAIFEENGIRAEICLRISFPEIFSRCPFSDTTKKGETLAEKIESREERAKELGVESIEYITLDELEKVLEMPRRKLCIYCALKNPV